jgi:hypothetical protein
MQELWDVLAREPIFSGCKITIVNNKLIFSRGAYSIKTIKVNYSDQRPYYWTGCYRDINSVMDIITRSILHNHDYHKIGMFSAGELKQLVCRQMCRRVGAICTPVESWDAPLTQVVIEKDKICTVIAATNAVFIVNNEKLSYHSACQSIGRMNLFPRDGDGLLVGDIIKRIVTAEAFYIKTCPLMSQKYPMRWKDTTLRIAGFSLNTDLNPPKYWNRIVIWEINLTIAAALPQPIAEEINGYLTQLE